jgi:DNA-binding MarR family transcriptional regulator
MNFELLEELFDEVRLGMHRLVQVTEALHADEDVTLGMRAVLEFLLKTGEATVPEIARSRHVSRQHIQSLVNPLLDRNLVKLGENPAHRRSPLVILTRAGESLIQKLKRKERRAFSAMPIDASDAQLKSAARTLRALRLSLPEVL